MDDQLVEIGAGLFDCSLESTAMAKDPNKAGAKSKESVRKLQMMSKVMEGFDLQMSNLRNRVGSGGEDEVHAPI